MRTPIRQSEIDMIQRKAEAMLDLFEHLTLSQSMTVLGLVAGALIGQAKNHSTASLDEIIERHTANVKKFASAGWQQ